MVRSTMGRLLLATALTTYAGVTTAPAALAQDSEEDSAAYLEWRKAEAVGVYASHRW